MSNHDRDPILLTPGPLTTSLATKSADRARAGLPGCATATATPARKRRKPAAPSRAS